MENKETFLNAYFDSWGDLKTALKTAKINARTLCEWLYLDAGFNFSFLNASKTLAQIELSKQALSGELGAIKMLLATEVKPKELPKLDLSGLSINELQKLINLDTGNGQLDRVIINIVTDNNDQTE